MEHIASALLGIGNGGVYAALALAIVITYRSSGVVNFATGAMALFGAYMYSGFRNGELIILIPGLPTKVDVGGPMPFALAAALALVACGLLGVLVHIAVFRPLKDAPPLARAVASLGVLVILQEMMALRLGTSPVSVKAIFPSERWHLGSILILSDRFYLAVSIIGLALLLAVLFRVTRFGLVTRASAESQVGAYVTGISPDRVALANWIIGAMVAGAAGILIAPLSPITPLTYTSFVVPALAAAVVGGFEQIMLTVAAGIAIGMLQAEALSLAGKYSWMPYTGSAELVPLFVILIALLATSRTVPVRGGLLRQPLGRAPRPNSLLLPTVAGIAIGVVALLVTSGTWRSAVIGSMIAAIIGLSLVVVTGYAGQVSVAQLSLAGAAAFTLSGLTQSWGVPFPLSPLMAAGVATLLGVIIGIPALRLRGLILGVVTLAFAFAIEAVWFRNTDIVPSGGGHVTQPKLFGIDLSVGTGLAFPRLSFGLMCLVVLVAVAWGIARLRRSTLGSAMLAVRANERSAAGLGVNVVRVKVAAFAIGSFIAGLGGSLLAYRRGVVTFDSFTALGNLTILSTAYLAGVTSVYGGVLSGVIASSGVLYLALDRWLNLGKWFGIITGIGLILTLIRNPEGMAGSGHSLAALIRRSRRKGRGNDPDLAFEPTGDAAPALAGDDPVLVVTDLRVRYGGVMAVDYVSLEVRPGWVVGLIGPNGAGKTSVIDAVTGFARSDGTVMLNGTQLNGLAPHRRVRSGLGRTFQSLELYDDLSVEENVSVAAAGLPSKQQAGAIAHALGLVGIQSLRHRPAGELSQGERQLVSIARAYATEPSVLLLDEPAAGLDTSESEWLGERIRHLADAGAAVLLVDHDIALVLGVCDHIYVLDLGRIIASGSPAEIRGNRDVAAAYLGELLEDPEAEPSEVTL